MMHEVTFLTVTDPAIESWGIVWMLDDLAPLIVSLLSFDPTQAQKITILK
jgi:hypothetical protein